MTDKAMQTERKLLAVFLACTLSVLTMTEPLVAMSPQQPRGAESVKARVQELYAQGSKVQLKFADGSEVQGRIIRVESDSFTIRQEKTDQEVVFRYEQVSEAKRKGLSRGAKAGVIGGIIGGAVFLVLCAAPYPIGFLCREDPS